MIEDVGHPIPGRTHVEGESFRSEAAGPATGLIVLFDQSDTKSFFGKMRGCGETCESGTYHTCGRSAPGRSDSVVHEFFHHFSAGQEYSTFYRSQRNVQYLGDLFVLIAVVVHHEGVYIMLVH